MKKDKYAVLKQKGLLTGTLKKCREKRARRDMLAKPTKSSNRVAIPFGSPLCFEVQGIAEASHPRKQNWAGQKASRKRANRYVSVQSVDAGKYGGQYSRYTCWKYYAVTRSFGVCTEKRLLWFFMNESGMVHAKRGWRFGKDENGIYVERVTNKKIHMRYHPCMSVIKANGVFEGARLHEAMQREKAKQAKLDKIIASQQAELLERARGLGVYVTMQDSRYSGNCAAGTIAFCENHGLDHRGCVPAEVLRRFVVNGHAFQVERAIAAAEKRTVEDLARGYCLIK